MEEIVVDGYVTSLIEVDGVKIHSVGYVKAINGNSATVYFIGSNEEHILQLDDIEFLDPSKTGKPYDKKICNICHILKNNDEFDVNQTDAKGRKTTRPSCKLCRVNIDGAALKPEEKRRLDAITPKGVFNCPICGKTSLVGITANLVRDHDHITGDAREWLCDSCNTGLGRFKDSVLLLEKAIEYLKKHTK